MKPLLVLLCLVCGGLPGADAEDVSWTTSGDPELTAPPLPNKKASLDDAVADCNERLHLHLNHVDEFQKNDLRAAKGLLIEELKYAFPLMPQNLKDLLHPFNDKFDGPCVYVLEKGAGSDDRSKWMDSGDEDYDEWDYDDDDDDWDGDDWDGDEAPPRDGDESDYDTDESEDEMDLDSGDCDDTGTCSDSSDDSSHETTDGSVEYKVGESGNCKRRVLKDQSGKNKERYTTISPDLFILSGLIREETIQFLIELWNLPYFGGIHDDKVDAFFASKVVRQLGELLITCAYEGLADGPVGETILRAPSETEAAMLDVKGMAEAMAPQMDEVEKEIGDRIVSVEDGDTWPTFFTELMQPKYQHESLFLKNDKVKNFLTRYLCEENVDSGKYGGFRDLVDHCPYERRISPVVGELSEYLGGPNPSWPTIAKILEIILEDEYEYPDDEEYADSATKILEESILSRDDNLGVLYRVRHKTMEVLRKKRKEWYEQHFTKRIEMWGKRLERDEDGNVVLVDGIIMTLHVTNSCHVILERGSHFLSLAMGDTPLHVRLNAVSDYLYESVFLYQIGLLSKNQLDFIQLRQTSLLLELSGITKSVDSRKRRGGSIHTASRNILPNGVAESHNYPAAYHLRQAIPGKFSHRVRVYMLHRLQEERFNLLLELSPYYEKMRVQSSANGYYLELMDSSGRYKTDWMQYDAVHASDNSHQKKARHIIFDYHYGSREYFMHCVRDALSALYAGCDKSSNKSQLMRSRFSKFEEKLDGDDWISNELRAALRAFSTEKGQKMLRTFFGHLKSLENMKGNDKHLVEVGQDTFVYVDQKEKKSLYNYLHKLRANRGYHGVGQYIRIGLEDHGLGHLADGVGYKEVTDARTAKRKAETMNKERAQKARDMIITSEGDEEDGDDEDVVDEDISF